jgi:hypothetical protein
LISGMIRAPGAACIKCYDTALRKYLTRREIALCTDRIESAGYRRYLVSCWYYKRPYNVSALVGVIVSRILSIVMKLDQ